MLNSFFSLVAILWLFLALILAKNEREEINSKFKTCCEGLQSNWDGNTPTGQIKWENCEKEKWLQVKMSTTFRDFLESVRELGFYLSYFQRRISAGTSVNTLPSINSRLKATFKDNFCKWPKNHWTTEEKHKFCIIALSCFPSSVA